VFTKLDTLAVFMAWFLPAPYDDDTRTSTVAAASFRRRPGAMRKMAIWLRLVSADN
jgi:hypothetical protein